MSMENLNLGKNEIKILDDALINKISAGEVIERPASVVKELVENSIDANASSVTVEIKNGGINFIRVTDDGDGIAKDQIKTAFLNHATSKLKSFSDFDKLYTFGFRGEALCTIGAVSQTEMITKTQGEPIGTSIKIYGGKFFDEKQVASIKGTTVVSQNIFFNTPARLKFLKKPWVEAGYISSLMNKFVLANCNVAFKFINNGKVIFSTRGDGNLKSVLACILGSDIAKNVFEINEQSNKFLLEGYVARPEFFRNSRTQQNFFVNNRDIKNNILETAVENAFKSKYKLMIGQFPVYVLNLCVAPNFVDVNVHPNKLEIKFENDDMVYDFIFNAVTKNIDLIEKQFLICDRKSSLYISEEKNKTSVLKENKIDFEVSQINRKKNVVDKKIDIHRKELKNIAPDVIKSKSFVEPENFVDLNSKLIKHDEDEFLDCCKIITCLFDTYWLIDFRNKFFLLDQHAAHERILFEDIKNKLEKKDFISQKLIMPVEFELGDYEYKIFLSEIDKIKKFGFDIKNVGNKFFIYGVPIDFEKYISREFFFDLVEEFKTNSHSQNLIYKKNIEAIVQNACKKAIKARDKLSDIEIKNLVKKIFMSENMLNCPHGRPIIAEISKDKIERLFMRRK